MTNTKTDLSKFNKEKNRVRLGMNILKKIRRKYRKDITVCVSPYPSIGDSYLAGLYLNACYGSEEFVVTAIGSGVAEVYHYLDISNVYKLTQDETDCLIQYCRFMGTYDDKVKILHYQPSELYTGIAQHFHGVNGLNYADIFESIVFPEMSRDDRVYPVISEGNEQNYERVLRKGKSVVIFPYADTLDIPDPDYWINLVKQLKKKGYLIATYVQGDEKAIEGTIGVTCKLSGLVSLVEYAGYFISVRNGLSDIMSRAKCRKMVLYPTTDTEAGVHGRLMDFWSLRGFGYAEDIEEYEWKQPAKKSTV